MNRTLIIICIALALCTRALANDSLIVTPIDSIDTPIFFDEALAVLDTTECSSDTLISDLPDSVYKARLQALPFVIEVPYNEVVRRYIQRYVKHSPRQLASLQRKAEYYFPLFEDILGKHNLPYELCYLAVVESALNPQAHSHMGVAGLWQVRSMDWRSTLWWMSAWILCAPRRRHADS